VSSFFGHSMMNRVNAFTISVMLGITLIGLITPIKSEIHSSEYNPLNSPIVFQSKNYPSELWMNLDATITATQKDSMSFQFHIDEKPGRQGSGAIGRFLLCNTIYVGEEKKLNFLTSSEPKNNKVIVIYLEEEKEDIQDTVRTKYAEYEFYGEVFPVRDDMLLGMCGMFLGDVYYQKRLYEKAASYYTKLIELDPQYTKAYYQRGNAYDNAGLHELAITDYTKGIELAPSQAMLYNNRGWSFIRTENYDSAIADFSKAIDLKPENERYYWNRGFAYKIKGQQKLAITDFSRSIEINPNHAHAYAGKCDSYRRLGLYENAIVDCSKAIDIDPLYNAYYYFRGNVYLESNQYDKAISDYTTSIELKRDYAKAYYFRARAYASIHNCNSAIQDYQKSIELNPEITRTYNDESWLLNCEKNN